MQTVEENAEKVDKGKKNSGEFDGQDDWDDDAKDDVGDDFGDYGWDEDAAKEKAPGVKEPSGKNSGQNSGKNSVNFSDEKSLVDSPSEKKIPIMKDVKKQEPKAVAWTKELSISDKSEKKDQPVKDDSFENMSVRSNEFSEEKPQLKKFEKSNESKKDDSFLALDIKNPTEASKLQPEKIPEKKPAVQVTLVSDEPKKKTEAETKKVQQNIANEHVPNPKVDVKPESMPGVANLGQKDGIARGTSPHTLEEPKSPKYEDSFSTNRVETLEDYMSKLTPSQQEHYKDQLEKQEKLRMEIQEIVNSANQLLEKERKVRKQKHEKQYDTSEIKELGNILEEQKKAINSLKTLQLKKEKRLENVYNYSLIQEKQNKLIDLRRQVDEIMSQKHSLEQVNKQQEEVMKSFTPDEKGKEELSDLNSEFIKKRELLKLLQEEKKTEEKVLDADHNNIIVLKRKLLQVNSQYKQIVQLKQMRTQERNKQIKKREEMIKDGTKRAKLTGKPYNPEKDRTLPKIESEEEGPTEFTQEMIDQIEAETEQIIFECNKNHQDFGRILKDTEEQTSYWASRNKDLTKSQNNLEKELHYYMTKLKKQKKNIKSNRELCEKTVEQIKDEIRTLTEQRNYFKMVFEQERIAAISAADKQPDLQNVDQPRQKEPQIKVEEKEKHPGANTNPNFTTPLGDKGLDDLEDQLNVYLCLFWHSKVFYQKFAKVTANFFKVHTNQLYSRNQ